MNYNIKTGKAANKWIADDPKSPPPDPLLKEREFPFSLREKGLGDEV